VHAATAGTTATATQRRPRRGVRGPIRNCAGSPAGKAGAIGMDCHGKVFLATTTCDRNDLRLPDDLAPSPRIFFPRAGPSLGRGTQRLNGNRQAAIAQRMRESVQPKADFLDHHDDRDQYCLYTPSRNANASHRQGEKRAPCVIPFNNCLMQIIITVGSPAPTCGSVTVLSLFCASSALIFPLSERTRPDQPPACLGGQIVAVAADHDRVGMPSIGPRNGSCTSSVKIPPLQGSGSSSLYFGGDGFSARPILSSTEMPIVLQPWPRRCSASLMECRGISSFARAHQTFAQKSRTIQPFCP